MDFFGKKEGEKDGKYYKKILLKVNKLLYTFCIVRFKKTPLRRYNEPFFSDLIGCVTLASVTVYQVSYF